MPETLIWECPVCSLDSALRAVMLRLPVPLARHPGIARGRWPWGSGGPRFQCGPGRRRRWGSVRAGQSSHVPSPESRLPPFRGLQNLEPRYEPPRKIKKTQRVPLGFRIGVASISVPSLAVAAANIEAIEEGFARLTCSQQRQDSPLEPLSLMATCVTPGSCHVSQGTGAKRLTVFVSDVPLFGTVLSVSCWPGRSPKPQSKWPICGREAQCEVAKKLGCSMSDLGAKRRGPRKCRGPVLDFRQGASLAACPGTDGGSESQLNSAGARSPQTSRSPTSPKSRLLPIEQSDSATAEQTRRRVADQERLQGSALTSVALRRTLLCRGSKGKGQLTTRLTRPARQLRVALQVLSGRTQVPIARPLEARPPKAPPKVLAHLPPGLPPASTQFAVQCRLRRTHCLRRRHSHFTPAHLPSCLHRVLPLAPDNNTHARPKQYPPFVLSAVPSLCPLVFGPEFQPARPYASQVGPAPACHW